MSLPPSPARTTRPPFGHAGLILLEILIALVVLSLGMLALARLASHLTRNGAEGRTQVEALALANAQLEALRHPEPPASGQRLHRGHNATITLTWRREPDHTGTALTEVHAHWTEADTHAGTLTLASRTGTTDPLQLLHLGQPHIAAPARILGPARSAPPRHGSDEARIVTQRTNHFSDGDRQRPDGTLTVQDSHGRTRIVDGDSGQTLLEVDELIEFSSIAGTVFLDGAPARSEGLDVLASGETVCLKLATDPHARLVHDSGKAYSHFHYHCYLPPGWYGSVAVVSAQPADTYPHACLGDPGQPDDGSPTSRHPRQSPSRHYRGSLAPGNNQPITAGIGMRLDHEGKPTYRAEHLDRHHFLLTRLPAPADDPACRRQMARPDHPAPFGRNPGLLHCLQGECG